MSELKSQDLKDYTREPTAVGASYTRFREEAKKLKEENDQLTERMKEMMANMTKLKTANKSLSESVEQSEEEKGLLSCQVEELKAQLQDSARCGVSFLLIFLYAYSSNCTCIRCTYAHTPTGTYACMYTCLYAHVLMHA